MEDHRMALSLSQACRADRVLLASAVQEENRAVLDHALACRLSGVPVRPTDSAAARELIEETLSVLSTLDEYERKQEIDIDTSIIPLPFFDDDSESEHGGPSNHRSKGKAKADDYIECCACLEFSPEEDAIQLSCDPQPHSYCRNCLMELFEASMKDRELYPPRCCRQAVPLDSAKVFFTEEFLLTFEEKSIEHSTSNATYCSDPICSKFIPPSSIKDEIATCPACHHATCTGCGRDTHDGLCPEDPNTVALMDVARQENGSNVTIVRT